MTEATDLLILLLLDTALFATVESEDAWAVYVFCGCLSVLLASRARPERVLLLRQLSLVLEQARMGEG